MFYRIEERVFAFIQGYQRLHQQTPSFPEIADGCQISLRTARKYVETLQRWVYLAHDKGKVRAIRLLKHDAGVQ